MRIHLTIDVECYSGDYDREVWGHGLGLEFILGTLSRYGIRATFFIETMGIVRWGEDPLRRIAVRIAEEKHDLQLHLHPEVAHNIADSRATNRFFDHTLAMQEQMFAEGLIQWARLGLERVAVFRAGDLAADANTLAAMLRSGITAGSNRDLDTRGSIQSRANSLFTIVNDADESGGIYDMPVSVLRSPLPFHDGIYRHLQITAVSAGEMRYVLERMGRTGYVGATILTHPGEFFTVRDRTIVPNAKNRRRLNSLCAYIAARPARDVSTMRETAMARPRGTRAPPIVRGALSLALVRMVSQARQRMVHF